MSFAHALIPLCLLLAAATPSAQEPQEPAPVPTDSPGSPPPASPTGAAERFAPVGELAGSCWLGTFSAGGADEAGPRDLHCYEWVLQDRFLRDRHRVTGGEGVYEGETFYGWDAAAGKLRYWYFNSLGGVSEGTVALEEGRWTFRESHRGGGQAMELRTVLERPGEDAYTVATEIERDGTWQAEPAVRYQRLGVRPAETGGPWAERYDLAFNSDRDGDYEVYRRDLTSGRERNLTSAPSTEWVYDSRGGLVLVSNRTAGSEGGYRLYLLETGGGEPRRLGDFVVADSWVGVLPEGRGWVVCAVEAGDKELFLLGSDGTLQRRLTDNDADDCQPDVTPDGKTVVFWSNRGGSGELWAFDLEDLSEGLDPAAGEEGAGAEARLLTRFPGNDRVSPHRYGGEGPPRVSPDGHRIAWMSIRDGDTWDVYTMALDGSDVHRVTDHLADDGYPSWSPDGRYLAFDSNRYGSFDLFVVEATGGTPHRVTDHPASEQAPVWVARSPEG